MVAAHGYVSGAVVDGSYYGGYNPGAYSYMADPPSLIAWKEDATDNGFVDGSSYAKPDIICHKDATPGAISADIKAGGKVELQWTEWPESHHGPVITYLANCKGDCSSVDKSALEFFKIDEAGLISDSNEPGTWASDKLISANNSWTVTIPSTIASGNYVLRHEIIALHSAGQSNGAQNYPQCVNLKVTGGGSDSPSGTLGTKLYTNTDPGILVNIYTALKSYTIPGPALYSGASSGSATTAAATTAAATTPAVTATPSVSASTVSATPSHSPSSFSHFSRTRTLSRPAPSSTGTAPSFPSGPDSEPTGAPAATETNDATKTVDSTAQVTDEPISQTASAPADSVTVTATAIGGQSAQSSTPASGGSSAGAVPTPAGSSSSDYSTYLSSLSADQLLSVIRSTVKWLVSDSKVHARALSS
jgi:hypothetical protein